VPHTLSFARLNETQSKSDPVTLPAMAQNSNKIRPAPAEWVRLRICEKTSRLYFGNRQSRSRLGDHRALLVFTVEDQRIESANEMDLGLPRLPGRYIRIGFPSCRRTMTNWPACIMG
jgi:hypothetical protein